MSTLRRIALVVLGVITTLSTTSAFFWGSSSPEPSSPYPQYYYHQRVLGAPTAYTVPGTEPPVPVPVPSIPVQVPLQAQLAPAPAVHNVQLVPCLCPVSQDIEYEKYEKVPQEYFVTSQHKTN